MTFQTHNLEPIKWKNRFQSLPFKRNVQPLHHEVAVKYMKGFGGVVSFEVKGDLWATVGRCTLNQVDP
jgi:hypothetical protein